ncbi:beta-glucosidase-like isoform X1 [Olea europaea subsp. europaea]|uniref:Beta-glucosidase-like isoform X1 n=1 Tax=Olea europaea subsp. europaea TaxID=158383 RepID=A0A8S0S6C9_OLEEU|nr:beta-glucosidase-like isoform X1 [Olea europaea subsp. europaea]
MDQSQIEVKCSSFPKDFISGAATSAYQIEGAWNVDGKGRSIWDYMTLHEPDSIADGSNGCIALDHYNRFKEDVALMKKVGLDSYRFSISWPRILPGGRLCGGVSKEGIKYYNDLIDYSTNYFYVGIEPCATLFHWDVPQCLQDQYGGFLDHQIVFSPRQGKPRPPSEEQVMGDRGGATSTEHVMSRPGATSMEQLLRSLILQHRSAVPSLITPSERDPVTEVLAMVTNLPAYMNGIRGTEPFAMPQNFPDFLKEILRTEPSAIAKSFPDLTYSIKMSGIELSGMEKDSLSMKGNRGREPYIVAHNLILAHAHAVDIYRKHYKKHQGDTVGMTNVSTWFYPLRNTPEDAEAASRAVDFMLGWFVAPVITGDYPPSMRENVGERLPIFKPDEVKLVRGSCDFLGINYYTTNYAKNITKSTSSPPHYDNDRHVENHTHRNGVPIGPRGGSMWLYIVPEGIFHLMPYIKEKYNNPAIFITENGVDEVNDKTITISKARVDEIRIKYHRDHLAFLKKAMEHGVRVKGYFIWSFLDNFEWTQGYNLRFGIFYVDFENGHLTRFPKSSAV